ncbi:MAG: Gfo/Idh/MocA family oxidoreductase [Gemmataceae bacterium]|nr:Gfo/Idh/MocA family oxidoreductase [Gemmataceae bacterium]
MTRMTRRSFLAVSAAAPLLGRAAYASLLGANDRIRVAVMGVRGRGRSHVDSYLAIPNVEVAYICDVDKNVVGPMVTKVEKASGKAPVVVSDIRKVLEDKSIDAISIATTNHWHALATVWACQAGKDVYVEKPGSHNVVEGRRMIEAARKYNRMVQHGTQSRSYEGVKTAVEFVRSGKLGKISFGRALVYKGRDSIGKHTQQLPVPEGIDYDLWLGPAPKKPIERLKLHYDWHWMWDYGNGEIGNTGVHQIDIARLVMGKGMPTTIQSVGGRFGYEDDAQTPNTQLALFGYDDCQLLCEIRGLKTPPQHDVRLGEIWYGSEGILARDLRGGTKAYLGKSKEPLVLSDAKGNRDLDHFQNFIKAMKSRKSEDLNADIAEGHISSAMCHLANISHRLGKETAFDVRSQTFADSKEASESFQKLGDHLKDNGVKLEGTQYRLGRALKFDVKAETVPGDKEANALLNREYRMPFVVPEKV